MRLATSDTTGVAQVQVAATPRKQSATALTSQQYPQHQHALVLGSARMAHSPQKASLPHLSSSPIQSTPYRQHHSITATLPPLFSEKLTTPSRSSQPKRKIAPTPIPSCKTASISALPCLPCINNNQHLSSPPST